MEEHLLVIRDEDIFGVVSELDDSEYSLRTAVKVILFDQDKNIALVGRRYSLLPGGGGREFVLVNSCDAIIAISGGSGTLTEMAIAYQSNIPIVVMGGTGGWAEKIGGTHMDSRNRIMAEIATTPKEAVAKVLEFIQDISTK